MRFLIISGNPKTDGLTAALLDEIARGARDGGADVEVITLDKIERCKVCGGGWGNCRATHKCVFGGDGFDAAQEKVYAADAVAIVTPVYWAEVSELLKGFLDRLRRCEFAVGAGKVGDPERALSGKQVILAVNAGGSGNGINTALAQLERFCQHTGAQVFDTFGLNRWNHDHKRPAAYASAKALAQGRRNGQSI